MGSGEVQDDRLHGGKHDACQVSVITACSSFFIHTCVHTCVCVCSGVYVSARTVTACTAEPLTVCVCLAGSLTAALTWLRLAGGRCLTWRSATSSWCVAPPTGCCREWLKVSLSEAACLLPRQIGVSQQLSTVSSYVVDLKRVKKSGGSMLHGAAHGNQLAAEPKETKGFALRRSYERPSTSCSSQRYRTYLSS